MGLQLEDGHGSGALAKIVEGDKILVKAITATVEHEINHDLGLAFSTFFSQSPTAAGDCIFWMQNTDDRDLIIEGFDWGVVDCTADDTLYWKCGDTGTRNAASTLTPVNMNRGSGLTADGTFEYGADLDGGAATLAGGTQMGELVVAGATDKNSSHFNFPQDLVLKKNDTFSLWVGGSAAGTWYINVHFNYHSL